ncbi:MAG: ABC transporter permease [Lachnospiraceae bacterium]|nr:ABC transporter permease [Lachnospiraceae bacterium]
MNLYQRAVRSCLRKPIKSVLLLLTVFVISLLFLAGAASRSASIATKDSTRQAIGAGFLLEINAENRSQRVEEASQKILEQNPDGEGSYDGYHQEKITINGMEGWRSWADHSFESLRLADIEKVADVEGISDYNISTAPTVVKQKNFKRIEDSDADQTNDFQGVTLIGNRDMALNTNVLSGNVTIKEGRMTTKADSNVCVISEELAEQNHLKVGDILQFQSIKKETAVLEAEIVGIYQVKERMQPYMSGDTFRSENMIFTDLDFPETVEQEDPLYESAYFKAADVDVYDEVKASIRETDIDWQRYDLIDNNGNLDTMASNFNDLEKISNTLLIGVTAASFVILFLIFIFWIRNRNNEIGILLSIGISKGKILLQILTEAAFIGMIAVSLSFLIAPAVSDIAADYLVGQQAQAAKAQEEMDKGKVATDYQAPELTVMDVEVEITSVMLLTDAIGIGMLMILSTSAASILILRKNPKDILSEMS